VGNLRDPGGEKDGLNPWKRTDLNQKIAEKSRPLKVSMNLSESNGKKTLVLHTRGKTTEKRLLADHSREKAEGFERTDGRGTVKCHVLTRSLFA